MSDYSEQDKNPTGKTPSQWHKHWGREMEAAEKRLRKFLKQGNKVVERYLDQRVDQDMNGQQSRLNLFYTNVSTLQSMLYGSVPKIEVSREHHDPDDDVARVACLMYERMLQADVEPSGENLPTVLKACLQDRLLPGLGIARVRYDFETSMVTVMNPETMQPEQIEQVSYEDVPVDYVHWQDFRWGWARTWAEIPWMAFRAYLTKDEASARFGDDRAEKLEYKNQTPEGEDERGGDSDQQSNVQKAEIWEIWNLSDRRVYWWSAGCDYVLDIKDDPLGLIGFWPIPKPLIANNTTKLFIPRADFILAQDLYNEVDELQTRISVITKAIKVVGVYDQSASSQVGRMLKEGIENDLIPVDNWAMFAEKGGLRGAIDWFPVETISAVLQQLQGIQQQKIQQLYEVTGLSDIMRGGATDQYTAAATQGMKMKMGSIRVQALQDEFARFASDLEALKSEVISKHFSEESILKQSGAQFLSKPDQELIMPALQLMKSPEVAWRVDIRPESIAMVDYAQLKSERTEFLTAMSTYIQSAQAAVNSMGPTALPVLMELMKWGMAGFKGANYLEGIMDQAIQTAIQSSQQQGQEQEQPSPEQMKMQTEQMKLQGQQQKLAGEIQKIQAKSAADMQSQQAKLQAEIAKIQTDSQADMTLEQTQAQNRLIEISRELEASMAEIQAAMRADLTVERAQASFDIQSQQNEHQNNLVEVRTNAALASNNQSRNG